MIKNLIHLFCISLLLCLASPGIAQPDLEWKFTTYGFRDGIRTKVTSIIQDNTGYIWLATFDGLIRYDGYNFITYRNDNRDSFSLGANNVTELVLDQNGYLWAGFATGGIARYEPTTNNFRNFHVFDENKQKISDGICMLFADEENSIWIGVVRKGVFRTSDNGRSFHHYNIIQDTSNLYDAELKKIYNSGYNAVTDKKGRIWFATHDGLYLFNKQTQTLEPIREKEFTGKGQRKDLFNSILVDQDGKLWLGAWAGGISSYDPEKNKWQNFLFNSGFSPTMNIVTDISFCSNECIWLTSAGEGFGYFDLLSGEFTFLNKEKEHKADQLPSQRAFRVMHDRDNNLWISHGTGLTKIEQKQKIFSFYPLKVSHSDNFDFFQVKKLWQDSKKRFEFVATYYADGLHIKELRNGKMHILKIPMMAGEEKLMLVEDFLEDRKGRIWVLTRDHLMLFDPINIQLAVYPVQPPDKQKSNQYSVIKEDKRGEIWISSFMNGVFRFNPETGSIRHFHTNAEKQSKLEYNVVNTLNIDKKGRVWMGSWRGSLQYYYPEEDRIVPVYLEQNGERLSNKIWSILEDKKGYMWFGTDKGWLQTDPSTNYTTIASYTAKEGITGDIVYHSAADSLGNLWGITINSVCMINPERKFVRNLGVEVGYNLRDEVSLGIIPVASNQIIIPGSAGYYLLDPTAINEEEQHYKVLFTGIKVNDKTRYLKGRDTLTVFPGENFFSVDFTVVDFNNPSNIQYAYKLEGFNKGWINAGTRRNASYSRLAGGYYTFKVKAGISPGDESTQESSLVIHVIDPLYKRVWFQFLLLGSLIAGFIFLIRNRNKKISQQKDLIEIEKTINYFASSMNDKKTVDDILWDVTRNCIGKMHFEDCVIYLLDEDKKTLIQKASYGPKTDEEGKVHTPLKLSVGKGIVGAVAVSGKPEMISDTSKDPRYVVDDKARLSEITVPIIADGNVLGIIDCEHSKKNFFSQRHLNMLTTIASLCANKIIRVKAEAERISAQDKLTEVQQKMKDMEMQALRAQMNPHFIFNCLNSINRYIVKSDQATASLYLTRFAKLIRLILDNSNSKNVMLSNELEALKLYIDMESLRFEHKFSYSIEVDPQVNTDSIEVPPLIIQPYVENAIWHGLLHKENSGHLSIRVSIVKGNILQCVIEDNGVGRVKARELKSKTATTRKSLGMKLTESRISLLNQHAVLHATVEIEDLIEARGISLGTKVILSIPVEH